MRDYDNSRLDERLKQALLQAARRDYEELLADQGEEKIVWSTQYLRRRRKMLRNPDRYLRASLRPGWKKAVRAVSAAAIALCLLGGAVLFNPSARAQLMQFFMKVFDTYSKMIMNDTGEQPNIEIMQNWVLTWLPEGFEETDVEDETWGYVYIYSDGEDIIYMEVSLAASEYRPNIDNEHYDISKIKINGNAGSLFTAIDVGWPNQIFWIDEKENTAFLLYGDIETKALIKMAESLEKK